MALSNLSALGAVLSALVSPVLPLSAVGTSVRGSVPVALAGSMDGEEEDFMINSVKLEGEFPQVTKRIPTRLVINAIHLDQARLQTSGPAGSPMPTRCRECGCRNT